MLEAAIEKMPLPDDGDLWMETIPMRHNGWWTAVGICGSLLFATVLPAKAADYQKPAPATAPPSYSASLLSQFETINSQIAQTEDASQIAFLHLKQADVLEQLVNSTRGKERIGWMKQLADSLQVAGMSHHSVQKLAHQRLGRMKDYAEKHMAGEQMVPYVTYRYMQVGHQALPEKDHKQIAKKAEMWQEHLAQFVEAYPKGEDSPLLMVELAVLCEAKKDLEGARKWYSMLARVHPKHSMAKHAALASRRLGIDGKKLYLALPRLADLNDPFDIDQLNDKMIVDYFWSSMEPKSVQAFDKLSKVLSRYKSKGIEMVCVNVDQDHEKGRSMLNIGYVPGVHVHQRGGIEGRITSQYGIGEVPSMILLGKGGQVLHRQPKMEELESEIKKHLK